MDPYYSPLRFPGGKASILKFLIQVINLNSPINTYCEPYAGGAGAALGLLMNGHVKYLLLNDFDNNITSFWHSVLYRTDELIDKIEHTNVTLDEWLKQKEVLFTDSKNRRASILEIGFATFFLNRCNRSGILRPEPGPIGGVGQNGKWKIDARFNKPNLIARIRRVASFSNQIELFNTDAIEFMQGSLSTLATDSNTTFIYLDPPYYSMGPELYRCFYSDADHSRLRDFLESSISIPWVLSYDDTPFLRKLYRDRRTNNVDVNHFAHKAKAGKELIIASDNCKLPKIKNNQVDLDFFK